MSQALLVPSPTPGVPARAPLADELKHKINDPGLVRAGPSMSQIGA